MKASSLVLVALLLAAPGFADDAPARAAQPLMLTAAETVDSTDLNELGAFLDKKVTEVSEMLSAKIAAELPFLANEEKAVKTKF